ncbi:MAG: hypothetical protein WCX30_01785 [Candidatus Paceibacterota bacterium]|jgi:gas vesicle protein|nr:hypothetical protein [bacterium]
MNKKPEKKSNLMKMVIVGAGIASVAATAYFFLGSKGKKHQKHLKSWAIKMKGDVIEKIEEAKDVSMTSYHEIIDNIAAEYKKGENANQEEIDELAKDLKKHWKTISGSVKEIKKDVKKDLKPKSIKTKAKK